MRYECKLPLVSLRSPYIKEFASRKCAQPYPQNDVMKPFPGTAAILLNNLLSEDFKCGFTPDKDWMTRMSYVLTVIYPTECYLPNSKLF